jgi:hypothetical protein
MSAAISLRPVRTAADRRRVLLALASVEARRMLRHPALPLGIVAAVLFGRGVLDADWSGARYNGLPPSFGPVMLGISIAASAAFARDGATRLVQDAPVGRHDRAVARLLAGLPVIALLAVLVAAGAYWLRLQGGLDLGDEPGRTLHAHYTLPEILQPVVLGAFAVAFGAAVVSVVRNRLASVVVMFLVWFAASGAYWVFNGPAAMAFSIIQVQPLSVEVGPPSADPLSFPSDWLLSAPGLYQDHWARVVVSPALAAWHDVYLVGLTLLAAAVAVRGRVGRRLAVAGAVVAVLAVVVQKLVQP